MVALELSDRRKNCPVDAVAERGLLVQDEVVAGDVRDGDGRGSERAGARLPARDPADDDENQEDERRRRESYDTQPVSP